MSSQTVEMDESTPPVNAESRKALAFRMPEREENEPQREQVEEDDSFYDLTLEELRKIHSEVKKQRDIDDQLLPRSKREEEESKSRPPKYEYNNTVIRIEFPDRMVLQGQFRIQETINDVKEFVRDHIKEPGGGFELFTSPPKCILADNARLMDLNLVPTAKVYIGVRNGGHCELVSDRPAVVPFECAQETARCVRRPTKVEESKPGPSKTAVPRPQESDSGQASKKIPKWFKTKK